MAHSYGPLVPPVITILLAVLTKEVYPALIIGVFSGRYCSLVFECIQCN